MQGFLCRVLENTIETPVGGRCRRVVLALPSTFLHEAGVLEPEAQKNGRNMFDLYVSLLSAILNLDKNICIYL